MSMTDFETALRPTIIRDPKTGLPIITSIGEVQERAMVERGQQVVQELQRQVAIQAHVIQKIRAAMGVLLLEAEDELMEFDDRELAALIGRELDEAVIDTPDGRKLWRIWLKGPKADAAIESRAQTGLSLVGGKSS